MWQESRNWMARFGPPLVLALLAVSVTHGRGAITEPCQHRDRPRAFASTASSENVIPHDQLGLTRASRA